MSALTGIRRKDKEITSLDEMKGILRAAKFVTLAMCMNDEPYLVTLSHGYDREKNCVYFHCAAEGKKIRILEANSLVWGQALADLGYVQGACDQLFATTQFRGRVTWVINTSEKKHALKVMIESLDKNPEEVMEKQLKPESIQKVRIGRIDTGVRLHRNEENSGNASKTAALDSNLARVFFFSQNLLADGNEYS